MTLNELAETMNDLAKSLPAEKMTRGQMALWITTSEKLCVGQSFTHVKTGGEYLVTGIGLIHDNSKTELSVCYVTAGTDAPMHIRPVREFFDGRFVL